MFIEANLLSRALGLSRDADNASSTYQARMLFRTI